VTYQRSPFGATAMFMAERVRECHEPVEKWYLRIS